MSDLRTPSPRVFFLRFAPIFPFRDPTLPSIKQSMKKLVAVALSMAALAPFSAESQQSSGTLAGLLSGQGLAGAKLERRFGNHLFVPVSINNKRAALMIDTGAPLTIIDKNSAVTFGLKGESTT